MNQGAITLKGTRVLLRGLGVGIRVGGEYALSDAAQAHIDIRSRRTTGKLVLDPAR